jgi:hypothetical protein
MFNGDRRRDDARYDFDDDLTYEPAGFTKSGGLAEYSRRHDGGTPIRRAKRLAG